ncbi:MAG: hypothetical protein ABIJ57_07555 [Pseudomonadota bacterium]
MGWDGYDSLMPSEQDLSNNWKKMPDLPPTILTPFLHAPEHQPDRPRIELPDGMARDMRDELKDGNAVGVKAVIYNRMPKPAIRFAVESLVKEMEQRTNLRLSICRFDDTTKWPITLDDKDGCAPPEVRFTIVPQ